MPSLCVLSGCGYAYSTISLHTQHGSQTQRGAHADVEGERCQVRCQGQGLGHPAHGGHERGAKRECRTRGRRARAARPYGEIHRHMQGTAGCGAQGRRAWVPRSNMRGRRAGTKIRDRQYVLPRAGEDDHTGTLPRRNGALRRVDPRMVGRDGLQYTPAGGSGRLAHTGVQPDRREWRRRGAPVRQLESALGEYAAGGVPLPRAVARIMDATSGGVGGRRGGLDVWMASPEREHTPGKA